jgi:hypothetical protein
VLFVKTAFGVAALIVTLRLNVDWSEARVGLTKIRELPASGSETAPSNCVPDPLP